ncbi:hypothetical protein BGZ72_000416, partial [Mortierella alpina]
MDSMKTTHEKSSAPLSGRLPNVTEYLIKKGDEYRDRGDFDKAKVKYEKAVKFYPSEAHDRLAILPLCR